MPICSRCNLDKDPNCFYRSSFNATGLQWWCKPCMREAAKRWDQAHADQVSKKTSRWQKTAAGAAYRKRSAMRDLRLHPERVAARSRLRNAVRSGNVSKPSRCETCGKHAPTQGHHTDYSKALFVAWLCARCHRRAHLTTSVTKGTES